MARGDTLERIGDECASAAPRFPPGLLLELPDVPGELVADEVLRPLQELLLRLVHGQPRHPLERRESLVLGLLELLLERLDVHLAVTEPLLAPLELHELRIRLGLLLEDALLDLHDLQAPVLHLGLDLAPKLDRLLARVDLSLAPDRLGLTFRVGEDAPALGLGGPYARA